MTILIALMLGLVFGSFINALVFRTHTDIPMKGRSKCVKCEVPIDARDLVPVLSFVLLKGRCRRCKASIPWMYPLVEGGTALAFVLIALQLGELYNGLYVAAFLRMAIFTIFLVIIFVYDLQYQYILDRFTLPAMVIAVILNLAIGAVEPFSMFIGAIVIGGFFYLQYTLSRGKWIGGGDIRMGVLMGLMLGYADGLLALFLAYAVGAIVGLGLIAAGKKSLGSQLPFGTFLALATFVALLWGRDILAWYMNFLV